MGWKRRSVLATAAGTLYGATQASGLSFSVPPVDSTELEIVEQRDAAVTVRRQDYWYYELDPAVEHVTWEVKLDSLSPLLDVYVMSVQGFNQFIDSSVFPEVSALSAQNVYDDDRSGWLSNSSRTYVLVFQNTARDSAIGLTYDYIGRREV